MKPQIKTLISSALLPALAALALESLCTRYEYDGLYENLPFEMAKIKKPANCI